MNHLDQKFKNLKMRIDPNDVDNDLSSYPTTNANTNQDTTYETASFSAPSSQATSTSTATTTTTTTTLINKSDLFEIVNNVFIHMEVKNNLLNQQNSSDSNEMDDDENDSVTSRQSNANESYFNNKENFINLLRNYKSFLDSNRTQKRQMTCNMARLQNQFSVEDDDSMDTESFKASNSANSEITSTTTTSNTSNATDKEMLLNEIKSFILKNKLASQKSDQTIEDDLENCLNLDDTDDPLNEDDILPRNLIVTSIPLDVFTEFEVKLRFEKIFTSVDPKCTFCYIRLFRRCCIQYEDSISAVLARFELDEQPFMGERLKIFLTKVIWHTIAGFNNEVL